MHDQKFALITGASEGLGKYFAIECAARLWNLILVALPGSELDKVAGFIIRTYGVKVVCYEKDISKAESCYELFEAVSEKGITISMLINNAGSGGTFYFDQRDASYFNNMISLNISTPTILCRLFLNDLKKNAPSYILNVSSLAGLFCLPGKQVYGGTKSYLIHFSKSLKKEVQKDGIHVSVVCPGGMNTSWKLIMQNRLTGTWLSRHSIMEPSVVASLTMKKTMAGQEIIIPGFWNKNFLIWNRIFPRRLKEFLTQYQMKRTPKTEMAQQGLLYAKRA